MKDKIQKIREEVKLVVNRRLNLLNDNYFDLNKEAEGFTNEIMDIIDSMQGEPQVKDSAEIQHVNETCKENGNSLTQEPVSEDLDEEIGKYCSNPENFITYIDVGFRQSPIKKDDIPLIIKAIRFGALWQKQQDKSKVLTEEQCRKIRDDAFELGKDAMKQQMMKKAFDFTKEHNTACVLASECLRNHGWFNRERDFNNLFRHLACVDKLFEGKFSGKTKVIVIKED